MGALRSNSLETRSSFLEQRSNSLEQRSSFLGARPLATRQKECLLSANPQPRAGHRVERLGADGDGVIQLEGGLLFVRGALPADLITVGKTRKDGKIDRAELHKVLEPSPDRVPSACDIAHRCGGCPLMAASPALETRFKESTIRHALEKAMGKPVALHLVRPEPLLGYRTRARLSFERARGTLRIGYLMPGTRDVVDAPKCVVLGPTLERALAFVRSELSMLEGVGELHLGLVREKSGTESASGELAVIAVRSESAQPASLYRAMELGVSSGILGGAELNVGGTTVPTRFGASMEAGTREDSEDVDGRILSVPLGGFRQAHAQADRLLGGAVLEMARPESQRVLELHAGHGNFTLALAARAESVIAVEVSERAAAMLKANLKAHGLADKVTVHALEGSAYFAKAKRPHPASVARGKGPEVVVLDPPRTGAKELVAPIVALGPQRIVYASCSPITLGRDLGLFAAAGYTVTAAQVFDLFPHTTHVESVVLLEKA